MTPEAFVYVWTNIQNGKKYIGKHKGSVDDGYISSGKYFNEVYNKNPSDFKRDIIFFGTDSESLKTEQRIIRETVQKEGWEMLYNLTSFWHMKQWTRKCLICGAVCYPENQGWALVFEEIHFDNCLKRKAPFLTTTKSISKKKLTRLEERKLWWRARKDRVGVKNLMNPKVK